MVIKEDSVGVFTPDYIRSGHARNIFLCVTARFMNLPLRGSVHVPLNKMQKSPPKGELICMVVLTGQLSNLSEPLTKLLYAA